MVVVAVTCVGGRLIYDIIRGIRAAQGLDIFVLGVDRDGKAHGRLLCDAFETVPAAAPDERTYIARIEELHRKYRIDVLLALSEDEARAIARHSDRLTGLGIRLSTSSDATVQAMTDKYLLLERASAAGIDTGPFVAFDDPSGMTDALHRLGYPERKIVIKPRRAAGSRGVQIVDQTVASWTALLPNRFCGTGTMEAIVAETEGRNLDFKDYIAMPHIAGRVYDVDCIAIDGSMLCSAARLRQLSNPLWPTSTGHKIDMDPKVLGMAEALCRAFSINGAADFDIAISPEGKPVLFDAAARFSGSVGGSLRGGMNFPGQLIRALLGMPYLPETIRDGLVLRPYLTMAEVPASNEWDLM